MKFEIFIPSILLWILHASFSLASISEFKYITCGSAFKLHNSRQNIRLHSHDVKYGSGSGQQSVTGSESSEDHNSYWMVRGPHKDQCLRGAIIKCGSVIRLQHLSTKRNLHSHLFQSPISRNQEVSAFGEGGDGDTGDNWVVVCSGKYWKRDDTIRLRHKDTNKFLHATGEQYGRPIQGQREIVGFYTEDAGNQWKALEGIYVRPNKKQ